MQRIAIYVSLHLCEHIGICAWAPGFAALGGDTIARPGDSHLTVRVYCLRGAGYLQLIDQTGTLYSKILSDQDQIVTAELSASDGLYVRAELRTVDEELKALTNPIYLGGPFPHD